MSENIIALVDCDAFFVSCEQAVDESLKDKPVCVLSNNDACIVARSREAKELGISMGMPYFQAKKQFPDAIYVSGNIKLYNDFSRKIMAILRDFSPTVEVYSIDEAFVELSGLKRMYKENYLGIVKQIRSRIKDEVGVNVSIGVSKSKVLAKLACEKAKPKKNSENKDINKEGIYLIGNSKIPKILKSTKVQEIWGIGKNTTLLFNRWGVLNCSELVEKSDSWLKSRVGKRGVELKHELLGECIDKVKTVRKLPKSIQNTRSFPKTTSDINYIKNALNIHIHTSCSKLRYLKGRCKTVSVMLRSKDFVVYSDKKNLSESANFELEISRAAFKMLEKLYDSNIIYRSCGVTLDNLDFSEESQLSLFMDCEGKIGKGGKDFDKLGSAIDKLEKKFGKNTVRTGFFENY
jgi:nucleotidyltransferase/DNA polymerase involved in DNA repair